MKKSHKYPFETQHDEWSAGYQISKGPRAAQIGDPGAAVHLFRLYNVHFSRALMVPRMQQIAT